MKKVLKKMVGLLLATMMIGSILVGSVSAAEVKVAAAPTTQVTEKKYEPNRPNIKNTKKRCLKSIFR